MQKKLKKYWKLFETGCILIVLFTALCVCAAAETKPVSVSVQLADPETESELAANKKELAKLKAEAEKLRTENIQKQTENAQKTAELERLAKEKADLEAELTVLKRELGVSKQETQQKQNEISGLKAEITRLKSETSKSTMELQAENSLLAETNQNLRSELLDTLERCARLSNRVKRMEQSTAGVLETLAPVYTGTRENEFADALDLMMKSGMQLVAKSTNVCEMLYPQIDKLGLADVEKARLRVALDALSTENQRFARLSVPSALPEQFKKCRVLEISESPEAIVLNAGYRDGVRVNMKLQAGSGQKASVLRVVAVRPFVCAAVVVKGSSKDLGVGQEVYAMQEDK